MGNKKIKIFVSRRRELDSATIKNKIYVNVDNGAAYNDKRKMLIKGDDTGDNISFKAPVINELTVQYWAWKNYDLDYYGLCHYRRFLSFSDNKWPTDNRGHVVIDQLNDKTSAEFGLTNYNKMSDIIEQYDILYAEPVPVNIISTPNGPQKTVYDMWLSNTHLIPNLVFLKLLSLIEEMFPQYKDSLNAYLNSEYHIGYNCYIMKKQLLNELCNFQYPLLFKLESETNLTALTGLAKRCIGFSGEFLFGLFVYHVTRIIGCNYKELQLVFFEKTEKKKNFYKRCYDFVRQTYFQIEEIKRSTNRIENEVYQLNEKINRLNMLVRSNNPPEEKIIKDLVKTIPVDSAKEVISSITESDTEKIDKAIIINLLKTFTGICTQNNIRYWIDLEYLSVLSSIKEIIPNMKIIQVGMLREDLDKLINSTTEDSSIIIRETYIQDNKSPRLLHMVKFNYSLFNQPFIEIMTYDCFSEVGKNIDFEKLERINYQIFLEHSETPLERDMKIKENTQKCLPIISLGDSPGLIKWGFDNFKREYGDIDYNVIFPTKTLKVNELELSIPNKVEMYLDSIEKTKAK